MFGCCVCSDAWSRFVENLILLRGMGFEEAAVASSTKPLNKIRSSWTAQLASMLNGE